MVEDTARGRFVWHELMTPNRAGAQKFYAKVLNWKVEPWEQDTSYSMFCAPSGPLGGAVESQADAPYWLPYIVALDVDAAARQAKELGGSVKIEPTTMPTGGKYAALTDPQGGLFGVYQSADHGTEADAAPNPGEFSWHELATTDNEGAFEFYSALFGWEKVHEHDMGPMGTYLVFGRNGKQTGGMFNKGDERKRGPAYWVNYVRVQDVHRAVQKVNAERGTLLVGPMEVPGGDWIAQFQDPHGAIFAVHVLAADVKVAKKAPARAATQQVPDREEVQGQAKRVARVRRAAAETPSRSGGRAAKKSPRRATQKKSGGKKATGKSTKTGKAAAVKLGGERPRKKKATKKTKKKTTRTTTRRAKAAPKKAATKKSPGEKTVRKKSAGKKAAAKRPAGKKSAAKKSSGKNPVRGKSKVKRPAKRRQRSGR